MTVGDTATFGVDLGGTNLRVAVVDPDGSVVEERRVSTPPTLDGIVDEITDAVRAFAPLRPDARALGVGAAGMVDHQGTIHYSPNVPAFLHAPVRDRLEHATGLPAVVDNDANVAVVAELVHGAARGCTEVLLITLGTGIGGGVVTRGEVLRGAHGFGAEIGHFQVDPDGPLCACGQRGHWEALASGTALGALGREWAAAGAAPSVLARASGSIDDITGDPRGRRGAVRRRRRDRDRGGVRAGTSPSAWSDWSTSSIPNGWWCRAAWSSSATCCSHPCASPSTVASRAPRTVPRYRSWPPSSAGVRVWWAQRCWPGSSCEREARAHVAVVP